MFFINSFSCWIKFQTHACTHWSSKCFGFFHSKFFDHFFCNFPLIYEDFLTQLLNLKTDIEWEVAHETYFKLKFYEISNIFTERKVRVGKNNIINITLKNKSARVRFFCNKNSINFTSLKIIFNRKKYNIFIKSSCLII